MRQKKKKNPNKLEQSVKHADNAKSTVLYTKWNVADYVKLNI